jgi:hypothetical protein
MDVKNIDIADYRWLCKKCHHKLDFPKGIWGKNWKGKGKIDKIFTKNNLLKK